MATLIRIVRCSILASSIISVVSVIPLQAQAARARACGAELFLQGTGAQCGPTVYRQGVGAAQCGTSRVTRWSGWGNDCDKSLFTDLGDALLVSTTFGVFTGEAQTRVHKFKVQTRHKCSVDVP